MDNKTVAQPSATLLLPASGGVVDSRIRVKGTVSNIPQGKSLWLVHRRVAGGVTWPKEPMVVPDEQGRFEVDTFDGGASGSLIISLLLVNESVSAQFAQWLDDGHLTGNYPGLNITGLDCVELASVKVMYKPELKEIRMAADWERKVAVSMGTVVVASFIFLLVRNEPFASQNLTVCARTLLSLCVAIFGGTIPGFLNMEWSKKGVLIRASGALALFVITYFFTPQILSM